MDGESARLRARRIEAGWRGSADATNGGVHSSSAQREREEGEGLKGRRRFPCSREDKGGAQTPRIAGMSDAWRSSPASTIAGLGMGKTLKTLELSLLTRLNDFDSSLTH